MPKDVLGNSTRANVIHWPPQSTRFFPTSEYVTRADHPSLKQNNRALHRLYTNGVKVEYSTDDGKETIYAQIIDFQNPDNNDLLVVNQFSVAGTKQAHGPDVVVFVNGLPLAVVELKDPADESADVWKAYSQLQTYKDEISDLLACNLALAISDGITARVGLLTGNKKRFMQWNTIKNEDDRPMLEYQVEKVVRGFFDPKLFLDYMRYFVLFEDDGDSLINKIAGYHQFHGVREAVRVITIAPPSSESAFSFASGSVFVTLIASCLKRSRLPLRGSFSSRSFRRVSIYFDR